LIKLEKNEILGINIIYKKFLMDKSDIFCSKITIALEKGEFYTVYTEEIFYKKANVMKN